MNIKIHAVVLLAFFFGVQTISAQQHETHLQNIKQLTYGGDNAEAYFSSNNKFLTCQITNAKKGINCDQIFKIDINKASKDTLYAPHLISTGLEFLPLSGQMD